MRASSFQDTSELAYNNKQTYFHKRFALLLIKMYSPLHIVWLLRKCGQFTSQDAIEFERVISQASLSCQWQDTTSSESSVQIRFLRILRANFEITASWGQYKRYQLDGRAQTSSQVTKILVICIEKCRNYTGEKIYECVSGLTSY
jgi:hypothetical protein